MATVHFPEQMLHATGGVQRMDVPAKDYRELVQRVAERFPDVRQAIEHDMSVAIDGEIVFEPFLEPLTPNSEVHFLPRIAGG